MTDTKSLTKDVHKILDEAYNIAIDHVIELLDMHPSHRTIDISSKEYEVSQQLTRLQQQIKEFKKP